MADFPYEYEKNIGGNQLRSLRVLGDSGMGKLLARTIIVLFIFTILFTLLPWQQNIRGYGTLTALTPSNRPQLVPALISGRIEKWGVEEGQFVNKGDTLMVISEVNEKFIDPELVIRLQEQLNAKESELQSKLQKAAALREQIRFLTENLEAKTTQLRNKIKQTELKISADSADVQAAKLNFQIALDQSFRFKNLLDSGAISLNKYQEIDMKRQESQAKFVSVENRYLANREEFLINQMELQTLRMETMEKISKADADLNATLADYHASVGDLSKLRNDLASIEMRNKMYHILAPQDGVVVRAMRTGLGESVTAGDPVVTIAPTSADVAIEIYVKAMDVPLLSLGRKTRIEFDGFPALQVSGWPRVAVGTFGGVVAVIDRVESKNGLFRVLVVPDPDDEPWPKQLRLGSGVFGWILLDNVPIWYEIWRQLNGFPPSLKDEPDFETTFFPY
jgi:adhesin transport system membrane fusion protein